MGWIDVLMTIFCIVGAISCLCFLFLVLLVAAEVLFHGEKWRKK